MRKLILGTMVLLFALVQSGCSKSDNNDQTLFANLNWTQDVTEVDMSAFGMDASEITQNKDYKLASGEGTIRWLSDGVSYSKNITVGDSEI